MTAYSNPSWINPQQPLYLTFEELVIKVSDCQLSNSKQFLKFCPKEEKNGKTTKKRRASCRT
jgi:hypothetical protein